MENNKKEFFIGWQEKMPTKNRSYLKRIIIFLFVFFPILAIAIAWFQKPFNDHFFQLGKIIEVTGIYYDKPIPILIANEGDLPDGLSNELMLVGFGKRGAEGIMEKITETQGNINGKNITLAGTLIAGDGKSLLELTKKANSFISINDPLIINAELASALEEIVISGEILDPKCYFGVMKPGEGKVHKSCATRCISGGIPPIIKNVSPQEATLLAKYYVILDEKGNKINSQLLPFVGERVRISGMSHYSNGWNIIYMNLDQLEVLN